MTSIELLKQDLDAELKLGTKMVVNWDMYIEMHKQEIIQAFREGLKSPYHSDHTWTPQGEITTKSEQYYFETYKNHTQ